MRRPFQISLKGFIAFVLIVGGTSGWIAHKVNCKWRERAAVAALESAGAEILYDWQAGDEPGQPPGPQLLRTIAGDDFFARVTSVDLRPVAQHYTQQRSEFYLARSGVGSVIGPTMVTGPAMGPGTVAGGPGTASNLPAPPDSDELMSHVTRLETVVVLELNGMNVTDAGAKKIAGLKNLSQLFLAGNPLTDAGLSGIGGLKKVEKLDLRQTRVGDGSMKQLAQLPRLTWLRLRGTAVSDRGLADLAALKRLNYLDLRDTRVTRAGVQRLRESLPTCRVVVTAGSE